MTRIPLKNISKKQLLNNESFKFSMNNVTFEGKLNYSKNGSTRFVKAGDYELNMNNAINKWTDKKGKKITGNYLEIIYKLDKYFMYSMDTQY